MALHFADRSVSYQQFLDDVARKVAFLVGKSLREAKDSTPDMVSTEEAARILNISADRMRHIKDRFPHVKSGDGKQGRLLFKRDALLTEYAR